MDPGEISKALESFWTSIVPALIESGALATVAIWLFGGARLTSLTRRVTEHFKRVHDPELDRVLESYGLKKLVPIILLAGGLIGADAMHRVSHSVGNFLPGSLTYTQPDVLASSVPPEELAAVWIYYPEVHDLYTLNIVIDASADKADSEPFFAKNVRWAKEKYFSLSSRVDFIKFTLLVTAVLWSTALWTGRDRLRTSRRACLLSAALLAAAAFTSFQQVEVKNQENLAKTLGLRAMLESDRTKIKDPGIADELAVRADGVRAFNEQREREPFHAFHLRSSFAF
jgi:hypothetical protein